MSKNLRLLLLLTVIAAGMLGVAFAFVPLYRIFCQAVGIPVPEILVGRAGVAKHVVVPDDTPERFVTVRFMGGEAQGMPVQLKPVVPKIKVKLGEPTLTAYTAYNPESEALDGVAVHMLAGLGRLNVLVDEYVELQQCFCFERQRYPAQSSVNLPLSFTVTKTLPQGVHTITFSYTLFETSAKDAPKPKPRKKS